MHFTLEDGTKIEKYKLFNYLELVYSGKYDFLKDQIDMAGMRVIEPPYTEGWKFIYDPNHNPSKPITIKSPLEQIKHLIGRNGSNLKILIACMDIEHSKMLRIKVKEI